MAICRDLVKWSRCMEGSTGYPWSIVSWEPIIETIREVLMHYCTNSVPGFDIRFKHWGVELLDDMPWYCEAFILECILNVRGAVCLGWVCENLAYHGLRGNLK